MKQWIALLALSFLGAAGLRADTVFSTFGPGSTFFTGVWMVGGPPEDEIAASFVPSHDVTLDTIDFAASLLSGTDNDLTVDFAAGPSAPGAPIESFTVTTLAASPSIVTIHSVLHPLLSAGVTYWVVLSAPDPANTSVGWNLNNQGFEGVSSRQDDGAWAALGNEVPSAAFDVLGTPVIATVPEPSSVPLVALLFACAFATLGPRERRRRMQ